MRFWTRSCSSLSWLMMSSIAIRHLLAHVARRADEVFRLVLFKKPVDKRFRVEGDQVLHALADTNEPDRQPKLVANREDHTTARGAVQLGHDDARHVDRLFEVF